MAPQITLVFFKAKAHTHTHVHTPEIDWPFLERRSNVSAKTDSASL